MTQEFYLILFIVLSLILSYLIGSIPTAKIIASRHGVDITKEGSKNAGGTNVGRVIGKKAGILTMFLDGLKCLIPCYIALLLIRFTGLSYLTGTKIDELLVSLVAFAVCIGHSFPLFNHFKGGKCVACFAGYVLFFSPIIAVFGCATFFLVFFLKHKVSLSSLIAAPTVFLLASVPMILDFTLLKDPTQFNGGLYYGQGFMLPLSYVTFLSVMVIVALIVIRHKTNIKRLENGTEPITKFKQD